MLAATEPRQWAKTCQEAYKNKTELLLCMLTCFDAESQSQTMLGEIVVNLTSYKCASRLPYGRKVGELGNNETK